ncbi:hypothetical protein JB92DRAFT_2825229 [Gautieria morchelliformis]|nr:hypothetical protein JB92DRAFT_2825229 [Gautieria morchelliformis]
MMLNKEHLSTEGLIKFFFLLSSGHQTTQGCKLHPGVPPDTGAVPSWSPAPCGLQAARQCPTRRWCGHRLATSIVRDGSCVPASHPTLVWPQAVSHVPPDTGVANLGQIGHTSHEQQKSGERYWKCCKWIEGAGWCEMVALEEMEEGWRRVDNRRWELRQQLMPIEVGMW